MGNKLISVHNTALSLIFARALIRIFARATIRLRTSEGPHYRGDSNTRPPPPSIRLKQSPLLHQTLNTLSYRGTSLMRNSPPPKDHHMTLDSPTVGSWERGVSYERSTPVGQDDEQWLQRHPEAGSSRPSWPKAS